ncbi:amidase family protein [Actinokineospora sp. NBRC 105648]|uniref:amidase family protein n=1 Tax=Actinokineospora sp. NBRC 105648 TaxID=3032206 RepID=UPI0024A03552|nr:amidase family protein [Actinokineospora sp. NBRC 105648]GLZ43536.1 amidase [Actinokineospora sp. NBRC 105648]
MGIQELQRQRAAGKTTAVELTRAHLDRIDQVDPRLRAVLAVAPDAVEQARASDERARAGTLIGPLDGVTVLVKDNIDTADLPTTVGSRALAGSRPTSDAEVVRRLRAGGAVVLGKTNLSEWANFRSMNSVSGWSGVGGQTNNPFVLDHNPSGSSSGSAAAVAAGLCQVAIGTETNGSIVSPASYCGIVGYKPTVGLVSGVGIAPISDHQDTAGPMTRTVADAALTMAVLSDLRLPLDPLSLRGKRIGVWALSGSDSSTDRAVAASVRALIDAGAIAVEVDIRGVAEMDERSWLAMVTEFTPLLEAYLRTRPGVPHTLAELVEFNRQDDVELSLFGQELFELALDAPPLTDPVYVLNRTTAAALARDAIDDTLAEHALDAILAPTDTPAHVTGRPEDDRVNSATPAAVAGYPSVTLPAGFGGSLPIGVSLFTTAGHDVELLALAAAFEQVHPVARVPKLLPTLPM